MNESSRPDTAVPAPDVAAPKRAWHAPEIVETDYTETQVGAGAYTISDAATYGS
jgi:hypothetical protein